MTEKKVTKRLSDIPVRELKKGDEFIAEYLRIEIDVGENKSKLYTFKDNNGEMFKVWGCGSLDADMAVAIIGQKYLVKHEGIGEVKMAGRRPPKKIYVYPM